MLLALAFAGLVIVADQTSKALVVARLEEGAFTSRDIVGIRLRHVVNRRKPWGSSRGVRVMTVVWLLLVPVVMLLARRLDGPALHIALGCIIGGATGNLIDGISRRAVTDFIDLRVWPVFNIADAAIVAGAAMLTWSLIGF